MDLLKALTQIDTSFTDAHHLPESISAHVVENLRQRGFHVSNGAPPQNETTLLFIERAYDDYDPDEQTTPSCLEILRFDSPQAAADAVVDAEIAIEMLPDEDKESYKVWTQVVKELPEGANAYIGELVRKMNAGV